MKYAITRAVNFKEFGNSLPSGLIEMMFDDLVVLLKFLHRAQKEGLLIEPFFFTNQIDYLDSIWHHFILHTRLYYDFCMQELGEYMHHDPVPVAVSSSEENPKNAKEAISEQMSLLENHLGKDFVNRIFFIYPELLKRG